MRASGSYTGTLQSCLPALGIAINGGGGVSDGQQCMVTRLDTGCAGLCVPPPLSSNKSLSSLPLIPQSFGTSQPLVRVLYQVVATSAVALAHFRSNPNSGVVYTFAALVHGRVPDSWLAQASGVQLALGSEDKAVRGQEQGSSTVGSDASTVQLNLQLSSEKRQSCGKTHG